MPLMDRTEMRKDILFQIALWIQLTGNLTFFWLLLRARDKLRIAKRLREVQKEEIAYLVERLNKLGRQG
jgi:hypothetical protein